MGKLRDTFDGIGWSLGVSAALFAFALLAALLLLQTTESLLWVGQRVVGTEQGGIVTYFWQGQRYSLSAPGFGSARATSVFLDPGNPGNAMTENVPERTFAAALVGLPAIAGFAVLAAGLTRKRRWARKNARRAQASLLDPDFVSRHLGELRSDRVDE
ncbi:MAG TPA: hypothetical protein VG253_17670 [Streptosporangiaceae bacterium]|jgi:hypothetical protein|nr:hypothetical protein [Streptosporangiaceae bacterium]